MDDLHIPKVTAGSTGSDVMIRVSRKANALIEEIAKESGQSKAYIASRMIEYAYDFTLVDENEEDS